MRHIIFSFFMFGTIIATLNCVCKKNDVSNANYSTSEIKNQPIEKVSNGFRINKSASITSLLTEGKWKIQTITSKKPCDTNYDGISTTDIASEMPSCAMDDEVQFGQDGIVEFTRNEKCELTEAAIESYNWAINKNNELTMTRGSIEALMILRAVDDNQLIVDIPMEEGGEMYYFTVTYLHPSMLRAKL